MNKYVKKMALMVPYVNRYYEEIERYRSEIESLHSEIEDLRSTGIKYYSCEYIDTFNLRFLGPIDTGTKCMCFCCEPYLDFPRAALCETAEESVTSFAKLRAEIMAESIRFSLLGRYRADDDRKFTSECAKCPQFHLNYWRGDGLIHNIHMGMYNSPCQSKCIYCNLTHDIRIHSESNKKAFDVIEWAQETGLTAGDLNWSFASGEITINPFRERIFGLLKDQTAQFLTNCFIFDEKIAANLSANGQSSIYFSIDSGTPETWFKIKGVNNFETVVKNLEKYIAGGVRPEQILLKYLLLPGINDDLGEYRSIINIEKRLDIKSMVISADRSEKQRESLIKPAGYFLAMMRMNNIKTVLDHHFFQDEKEKISAFADVLMRSGEI